MCSRVPDQSFDIVVLGGGSGGYAAALRAAELGLSVGMIEKDKVGGTCLHRGCIPTKALLHAAEVADDSRESAKYGIARHLRGRRHRRRHRVPHRASSPRSTRACRALLKARGITVDRGRGPPHLRRRPCRSATTTITGKNVILATGSYSRSLPGLEIGGRVIDSEQALELDFVPKKVAVLGGGVIGVEFASVWKSFGADVTIIEALPHLVPNEDECCQQVARARVPQARHRVLPRHPLPGRHPERLRRRRHARGRQDRSRPSCCSSPSAAARSTADLGFEEAGVTHRPRLRHHGTTASRPALPGVYAVGDIVPGLQLAHRSFQQGIFVAEEIAGLNPVDRPRREHPRSHLLRPRGRVRRPHRGEGRRAVRRATRSSRYDYSLAGNARSEIIGTPARSRSSACNDGPVVGVHMHRRPRRRADRRGAAGRELGGLPGGHRAVHPRHPTQYEALGEAFLALAGKPLHAL